MDTDNTHPPSAPSPPSLPTGSYLPINRCNLPAVVLGGVTFQAHPAPLYIDGVSALFGDLYARLDALAQPGERGELFVDYMRAHFRLDALEEAGYQPGHGRAKADYIRTLRGWSFDTESREAAVLKGWVESRFGLLPQFHGVPIRDANEASYRTYIEARSHGLYNTNALESQLDLVYSFCQYELQRRYPERRHLRLFRGTNRLDSHRILRPFEAGRGRILLNNINSFSSNIQRADEFGDHIIAADIPLSKIFCFSDLLPGRLRGEAEFIVIGGAYDVTLTHALSG